jgi:shikimate dehydrogenase
MRTYGLIGNPVKHSFSPDYFSKKFIELGLKDCAYTAYELSDLANLEALVVSENLNGFNVTIPYKQAIIPMLSSISEAAKAMNAVNTVTVTRNGWIGDNTDYIGFRNSIKKKLSPLFNYALIFGTGGSSNAVRFALKELGVLHASVSRGPFADYSYKDLTPEDINDHTLLINTTPLGSAHLIDEYVDIPYKAISKKHLCFDLAYTPAETLFLKKAREQGARTMNGLQMLEIQADKSWEIWNKENSLS